MAISVAAYVISHAWCLRSRSYWTGPTQQLASYFISCIVHASCFSLFYLGQSCNCLSRRNREIDSSRAKYNACGHKDIGKRTKYVAAQLLRVIHDLPTRHIYQNRALASTPLPPRNIYVFHASLHEIALVKKSEP